MKGCVREVSLAQVSCILMYVYVAPPTPVGAWSMALGLRQRFEYYYSMYQTSPYSTSLLPTSSHPTFIHLNCILSLHPFSCIYIYIYIASLISLLPTSSYLPPNIYPSPPLPTSFHSLSRATHTKSPSYLTHSTTQPSQLLCVCVCVWLCGCGPLTGRGWI